MMNTGHLNEGPSVSIMSNATDGHDCGLSRSPNRLTGTIQGSQNRHPSTADTFSSSSTSPPSAKSDLSSLTAKGSGHVKPFEVPLILLNQGMLLLKVSQKSRKKLHFWIDPENFKLVYKQDTKSAAHQFSVDDIRSITPQELASHYREELGISKEFERKWLSLVYFDHMKNKLKNLHVICDTVLDLKKLLCVLGNLQNLRDELAASVYLYKGNVDDLRKSVLSDKLESSEKLPKQELQFKDALKYCRRLSINIETEKLQHIFDHVTRSSKDRMNFDEFKDFVSSITSRDDLKIVFRSIVGEKADMDLRTFSKFMTSVQRENLSVASLKEIFNKYSCAENGNWTEASLDTFLRSKRCPSMTELYLNADYYSHPLNEYYILSSHNTYLTGRQVAGDSSVDGYVRALKRGCRCLEIDIWNDQNTNSDPIVNHGRTFTNGVSLKNVLKVIKKFAFFSLDFPLILSLEIHCSSEGQLKVAESLREIIGDTLVVSPGDDEVKLPSPRQLLKRILVKVKKSANMSAAIEETDHPLIASTTSTSFSESDSLAGIRKPSFKMRRQSSNKVIPELSQLGVYVQGIKFRNFSLPESKTLNHCFSLSENSAINMLKDASKRESFDKHNRKFLMRVYPSRTRLMSSNFLPNQFWTHGVQMVATNWQTYDLGQQMNESLFDSVSGRGYILKPQRLRVPNSKTLIARLSETPASKMKVSVTVISAQQLPTSRSSNPPNPFVKVELFGYSDIDWCGQTRDNTTSIVRGNGFNPVWNQIIEGMFSTRGEIVFLRITVLNSRSSDHIESPQLLGSFMAPLVNVRQGYRYFFLKDSCGEQLIYSSLFLRIVFDEV